MACRSCPLSGADPPRSWRRRAIRRFGGLWRRPDLRVREARTTDAVNSLLGEAQLVILEPRR